MFETRISMRKIIKQSAQWLHASLMIAIIIPLLYALCARKPDTIGQTLYIKCLVIIFPVIMTDFIKSRCKGLLSYLILSVFLLLATFVSGLAVAGPLRHHFLFPGYMALLFCETVFIICNRLAERISKAKAAAAAKGEDPSWRPVHSILREPSFPALIYFLAVYVLALNLANPALCNAALFSVVVYTPVTFLYRYIYETEKYLSLNKRTCSLPSKRIYGIGSGMLAAFLLMLMIISLPALFTVSNRHYDDIRDWTADITIDYTDLIPENNQEDIGKDPMATLIAQYGEPKPAPKWLSVLFHMVETAIFLFLAAMLLKIIRSAFQDFRKIGDDNGDIVEQLEDTAEAISKVIIPSNRRNPSEQERIRKEYRKIIRRHRKDIPAAYESPIEIETIAGIAHSEDGKKLHKQYELARYGQESG